MTAAVPDSPDRALVEVLAEALHGAETSGGWWGHPECEEFARIVAPAVEDIIAARVAPLLAERAEALAAVERVRALGDWYESETLSSNHRPIRAALSLPEQDGT